MCRNLFSTVCFYNEKQKEFKTNIALCKMYFVVQAEWLFLGHTCRFENTHLLPPANEVNWWHIHLHHWHDTLSDVQLAITLKWQMRHNNCITFKSLLTHSCFITINNLPVSAWWRSRCPICVKVVGKISEEKMTNDQVEWGHCILLPHNNCQSKSYSSNVNLLPVNSLLCNTSHLFCRCIYLSAVYSAQ